MRALGEIEGEAEGGGEILPLRIWNAAVMDETREKQEEAGCDHQRKQEIEGAQVRRGV